MLLGCDSPLTVEACRHASEWGSPGCAALVVVLHEPDEDPAGSYTLTVSAGLDGGGIISHATEPRFGRFLMPLDLDPLSSVPVGSPVDIWVTARLVSTGPDSGTGNSTVYLAQDSVKTSVTFVRVGSVPEPDTVVLRPR